MLAGNTRAIATSHQHAILGFAEVGDAHGEPYPDRGQRDCEGEAGHVRQHAQPKIVRLIARPLISRQIITARMPALIRMSPRRMSCRARPELEHLVLVFRHNGLLGYQAASSMRCILQT
jgi:hypothetical protein